MHVYNSVFKFREPYQVLVDGDFMMTAISQKMDLHSRLAAVLGGTVKLMITQCTISHLIQSASKANQVAQEALDFSRKICERRKCNHWQTKSSSVECIKGILGDTENRLRYMICTQDPSFRLFLREKVIGVPILYVNRSGLLLLEEEGPATELKRKELEEQKLHVLPEELAQLETVNAQLESAAPIQLVNRPGDSYPLTQPNKSISTSQTVSAQRLQNKLTKKKPRKGGPNPLSVKKKKSTTMKKQRVQVKSVQPNPSDSNLTTKTSKRKRKQAKTNEQSESAADQNARKSETS
ncbi:hypothetical protein O181_022196 [Austropuccinia psidii MF-1]|uniref:UTP23 sensor motif region domain-containing protein n=1 Tax=Austropuccinia psidii MF-1 TaxID=1389203 RepID=A0A9Q3CGY6_9BASI|nr:hypothetical protein [Austropuccinia psidii MF-1]